MNEHIDFANWMLAGHRWLTAKGGKQAFGQMFDEVSVDANELPKQACAVGCAIIGRHLFAGKEITPDLLYPNTTDDTFFDRVAATYADWKDAYSAATKAVNQGSQYRAIGIIHANDDIQYTIRGIARIIKRTKV